MTVTYWRRECSACQITIDATTDNANPCPCCGQECTPPQAFTVTYRDSGPKADHPWHKAPVGCRCEWCVKVRIPADFRAANDYILAKVPDPGWPTNAEDTSLWTI